MAPSKKTRKEAEAFLRAMGPEAIPAELSVEEKLIWANAQNKILRETMRSLEEDPVVGDYIRTRLEKKG